MVEKLKSRESEIKQLKDKNVKEMETMQVEYEDLKSHVLKHADNSKNLGEYNKKIEMQRDEI